jgi:hypothetical protein
MGCGARLSRSCFHMRSLAPRASSQKPSSATNIQSFDVYTIKAMKEWKVGAAWRNRLLGQSMVIFSIDGTANVSSIKVDNPGEFSRAPAKSDTTSGVR